MPNALIPLIASKSSLLRRAAFSGSVAGLAILVPALSYGRKNTQQWPPVLNAISHSVWGEEALLRFTQGLEHHLPTTQ